ncbi:MAG: methyltransferase [Hyphomicrobiales bacterium]|nr:methyltransferase [Hyphomicrobiales bacterium]
MGGSSMGRVSSMPDEPSALSPWARLVDRAYGLRDRILASQRFQIMAARFPLTRSVSARRARACFDLCAGFVYSQVLFACVKLDLFELLARQPLTLEAIARHTGLGQDAARRLVLAAVSLDLLQARSADRYGLGQNGAAMRANPGVKAMIEHHAMFYADMADPVALLRGEVGETELKRYWPYADGVEPAALAPDAVVPYTELMATSQQFVAEDVLDAYDVSRHRRLMDVGGGDGSFLRSAAKRAPGLALTLFDLPAVVETARPRFAGAGLTARTTLVGGSFSHQDLPMGADLITLVRIAHDHGDDTVQHLLGAIHAALEPGGTLLIAEPMAGDSASAPMADAYFGFYLLAMGRGRARSPAELIAMLAKAGFIEARQITTPRPLLSGLIQARKPII